MEANPLQPIIDATFQKIHDTEQMLLTNDPMLPGHLGAIHTSLRQHEELNHLLSDEQIHQLIKAQVQVTGTVITKATATTSKASVTKQAKSISASDL